MSKLIDYAPKTGLFEGDLKYGRANGTAPNKHKDYAADRQDGVATNMPLVPLILVQPRDPSVWKKDPKVKLAKRNVDSSQHAVNYIMKTYKTWENHLNSNVHLTIGKQRI